jgi:hypothetical protein
VPFNIPILSSFLEARIQIRPDNSLIEFCATDIFQAVKGILVRVVFNEAKATWCFVEPIESHNKAFDLTAPASFLSH